MSHSDHCNQRAQLAHRLGEVGSLGPSAANSKGYGPGLHGEGKKEDLQ